MRAVSKHSKRYSEEFKADAVELIHQDKRTYAALADDLGVSACTLRAWYKQAHMVKKPPVAAKKPSELVATSGESAEERAARLERENARLRKENDQLKMDREILKKSGGLLREGKRMKFAFIDAEKAHFQVSAMCRLFGVTRQGYYAFVKRPPSARAAEEAALQQRVRESFAESRERYGSPRVLQDLRRDGVRTSKRRIERAMREQGLYARRPRRYRVTTAADPSHAHEPNVLDRSFTAEAPNKRWVTDITYIQTAAGWCYLAAILDLYSRAVVGWALDTTLSTQLPLDALHDAVRRRSPRPGLMHHSDRGCQYTSAQYRHELAKLGVTVSMSRKGNCWDNAVAESFFKTIKEELVHRQPWNGKTHLRPALFEYIEVFYNRKRLHSAVGYRTPAQVERDYARSDAA